jgi:hypothetical protein
LSGRRIVAATLAFLTLTGGVVLAAPPTDRILSTEKYTTDKARALAGRHSKALQELNAAIYHCWPWVDIRKEWIGFYRPKGTQQDDRYLTVHIYITQDPSPAFAKLSFEERAAGMFSWYVGPLLRRMTKDPALAADSSLDGFTAILEWVKPVPPINGNPVHEQIAVFMDRESALEYVSGRTDNRTLSARARVLGFDGETPLGAIKIAPTWDDSFVTTYKVQNYQLEPGVTC